MSKQKVGGGGERAQESGCRYQDAYVIPIRESVTVSFI